MTDKEISDFLLGLGTWRAFLLLWAGATLPLAGCLLALRIRRAWLAAVVLPPLAFAFLGGVLMALLSGFLLLLRCAL